MSQQFEPRAVDRQALSSWVKDSGQLMGRLGPGWILGWGLGLPLLAWGLSRILEGHEAMTLAAVFFMQVLGVICHPLLQNIMDQAAHGNRPELSQALTDTLMDLSTGRAWLFKRLRGQAVALIGISLAGVALYLMTTYGGEVSDPTASPPAPHPLMRASNLLGYLVFIPTILRSFGVFDFSYWLEVRHGVEDTTNRSLQDKARALNANVLLGGTMIFLATCLAVNVHPVSTMLVFPFIQLFMAAVHRCAYHDIFEGGTGVKKKSAVESTDTHLVPVLQA